MEVKCNKIGCIANRKMICTRSHIDLHIISCQNDLLQCQEYKQKTKENTCAICELKDSISCDGCKNFDLFQFAAYKRLYNAACNYSLNNHKEGEC